MELNYPIGIAFSATSALDMHSGMEMWGGMGWLMMLFMMVLWILVLLALAGGIYWLFTRLFRNGTTPQSEQASADSAKNALSILNERYARGEIDHDEYVERKRRLREETRNED